jgi:hypothetical protein
MSARYKMVLSVSPDRELVRFRHDTLSREGFDVISVHSEVAARYEIHFGRCGVLLLCHKLSRFAREGLAHEFERMCHDPYIVAFLAHPRDYHPPQAHVCLVHSGDVAPPEPSRIALRRPLG